MTIVVGKVSGKNRLLARFQYVFKRAPILNQPITMKVYRNPETAESAVSTTSVITEFIYIKKRYIIMVSLCYQSLKRGWFQ